MSRRRIREPRGSSSAERSRSGSRASPANTTQSSCLESRSLLARMRSSDRTGVRASWASSMMRTGRQRVEAMCSPHRARRDLNPPRSAPSTTFGTTPAPGHFSIADTGSGSRLGLGATDETSSATLRCPRHRKVVVLAQANRAATGPASGPGFIARSKRSPSFDLCS